MRFRWSCALGLLTLLLFFGGPARANLVPSAELFFTQKNGDSIPDATLLMVEPGDLFEVELRLTSDSRGIRAYSISVDFDSALDGRISLVSVEELLPPEFGFHLGIDTPWDPSEPNGVPGFIKHFSTLR